MLLTKATYKETSPAKGKPNMALNPLMKIMTLCGTIPLVKGVNWKGKYWKRYQISRKWSPTLCY